MQDSQCRNSNLSFTRLRLAIVFGCVLIGMTGAACTSPAGENAVSHAEATPGSQFDQDSQLDPLALRRQTLIVRDLDRSLALYRDAIGMTVIYDNIIRRPHKTEDREQVIRLLFLKANNDYVGVLGLIDYEYENPDHPSHAKPVRYEGFTPGNAVVLFNTTELEERWPLIEATPGVEVINGPTYTEYPSYDGTSTIRVNVTRFYDPDGFLVEYNEPIDRIH
jgi:catechol 2,3-dioxygenase-like lactoylglutathione lyase family enzyme